MLIKCQVRKRSATDIEHCYNTALSLELLLDSLAESCDLVVVETMDRLRYRKGGLCKSGVCLWKLDIQVKAYVVPGWMADGDIKFGSSGSALREAEHGEAESDGMLTFQALGGGISL